MLKLEWDGKKECLLEHTMPTDKQLIINKDKSVNFDTTNNIIIEGDNLDVLKLLQSEYQSKVKMIYIDPPYNTGNKGLYKDKYWKSKECKHSNWLSMMYPRLKLARELLRDDGVIFVSIDDNEQANLKLLMDEVFGEDNFVGDIIRKTKSTTNDSKTGFNMQHENCLIFAKNKTLCSLVGEKKFFEKYENPDNDPRGTWVIADPSARTGSTFEIKNPFTGKIDLPPKGRNWRFCKKTFDHYVNIGKIKFKKEHKINERGFILKRYKEEIKSKFQSLNSLEFTDNKFMNQVATKETNRIFDEKLLDYPKPQNFIQGLIRSATNTNDIILDFFAGSGTMGHAVMQLNMEDKKQAIENGEDPTLVGNRKYILVQLPEEIKEGTDAYKAGYKKISDITIERIKRAGTKILEENPNIKLDLGFQVVEVIRIC